MRGKIISLICFCSLIESGCKPTILTSDSTTGLKTTDLSSLTVSSVATSGATTVTITPATGKGYSSVTVDEGSQFLSSNLCSGVTIFGLAGTSTCVSDDVLLQSNAFRTVGTTQISQIAEVTTYAGSGNNSSLPSGYRDIPTSSADDTDKNYSSTAANSLYLTRPGTACGSSGTITTRIADCLSKNTTQATWTGGTVGNQGYGTWKLVYSSGNSSGTCSTAANECYEVWQDQRTGLVWSSTLNRTTLGGTPGVNWCLASGNAENPDPNGGTCTPGGSYQPASSQSYCAENGTLVAVPGFCNQNNGTHITLALCTAPNWTANTENYTTGTYHRAKGQMGANSTDKVKWRLPTKDDYLQADTDGIRFVMPDMGTTPGGGNRPSDGSPASSSIFEWTATTYSTNRTQAWIYIGDLGGIANVVRTGPYRIRCVGR